MWRGKGGIVVRVLRSVSVGGGAVAEGIGMVTLWPRWLVISFSIELSSARKKSIRSLCVAAARSFKVAMLLHGRC